MILFINRDSVAYTGVILLSDMTKMIGGNLEISMMNKELALEKIARGEHVAKETVQYEKPGKMILAQGSEILHHVTPVESTQERYQFTSNCTFQNIFIAKTTNIPSSTYVSLFQNFCNICICSC